MESLRPLGVEYDVLFLNGRESLLNYVRGIGEVRRRVKAANYDLIHAEFGLSGWVARCQCRAPVVVKFMGDDVLGRFDTHGRLTAVGRIFQLSSFVLARLIDAAIVMSEPMRQKLRLPTAHVIPTAVDLDLFRPIDRTEACQSLRIDSARKYVLFPYATDRPAKRWDLVQEAVATARLEIPQLEILQVAGAPRERMPLYYNAADVLVLASESEGSPNSIKEALATGLPIVSVEVGDASELLRGLDHCYLVPRARTAIAEKVIEICRESQRTQGRVLAEQFSLSERSRRVVEVYQQVMERERGRKRLNRASLVSTAKKAPPSRPSPEQILERSERLQTYLLRRHYAAGLLHGPDPGVRFQWRAWRFLKSALSFIAWNDDYVFMQTQGNWALAHWVLFDVTGQSCYREIALETAEAVLSLQTAEGTWRYPLPERRDLIATLENIWGATVLLAAYHRTREVRFLKAAERAYDFIVGRIGFQEHQGGEAINYFDRPRGKVPNNSVIAVWVFLRLWQATGHARFLEHVAPLLRFVAGVQLPSGEIPYVVESPLERGREHYLCFQYNAHMFLHLCRSERLRPGVGAWAIAERLFPFLCRGVQPSGACANNCASAGRGGPEVNYYTAALAAALHEGYRVGLADNDELAARCLARVLSRQRSDGSFGFSTGDYGGLLRDQRSYPRQQAALLFHLLNTCDLGDGFGLPLASSQGESAGPCEKRAPGSFGS